MSKKDKIYLGFVALLVVMFIGYQAFGPQPTDWSPSYSGSDKTPYGAYILENELSTLFPGQQIHRLTIPPFRYLRSSNISSETVNWIFLNNQVDFEPNELELLLERVVSGDELFVSASALGDNLADSLQLSIKYRTALQRTFRDDENDQNRADSLNVNLVNASLRADDDWAYESRRHAYFSVVDTTKTVILGRLKDGEANFAKVEYGDGAIFVHLFPVALTNYYLREKKYADYAFKSLSYLPVRNTVWDEYYKAGRPRYSTPMGYILDIEPLRNAWFLALGGIVLFMIFRGRREQRPIPAQQKPENSSLEFARTISKLYLEKGTHKEIMNKKIRFFRDYCRQSLGIAVTGEKLPPAQILSDRSGVPKQQVADLLESISHARKQSQITNEELEEAASQIDKFYKDSIR